MAGDLPKCVEVVLRRRGWLAHHAVCGLRSHIELDANFVSEAALLEHVECNIERTVLRRPRVALVVSFKEAQVFSPRVALGIRKLWFEHNERGIALARKHDRIVALHAPVIREI